ncbi:MAG: methionine synthase [Chloroflexota bacterium]|nr:methionine synthase [Chloroflexota bacterium]
MDPLDRLRVDQVGSLLRPTRLKGAIGRYQRGEIDETALRSVEDDAIRDAVAEQERVGMPVVTDGEMRRSNFQDSMARSIAGFDAWLDRWKKKPADRAAGKTPGHAPLITRHRASERISLRRDLPLEEWRFTSSLTKRPVKVTLIGPDRISQVFDAAASSDVYPTVEAFVDDIVAVERRMVSELAAAGCPYVQIDAPSYTAYVDEGSLADMRSRGIDPDRALDRSIAADNAVIAGTPDVTFGIHVCRGNERSMWHREGPYDAIAERLFTGLAHHRLLLEYDTDRAGTFAPLRFVPQDKVVVLGLVTTKDPDLESVDDLLRRIEEASRYVPVERLAISPQCGFASDVAGNLIDEDAQWRKLERVVEVGRRVWGEV